MCEMKDSAEKQWGAVRGILKVAKRVLPENEHEQAIANVEKHISNASDSIPPHLEKELGRVMRQMYATTSCEDDEPTLIFENLAEAG